MNLKKSIYFEKLNKLEQEQAIFLVLGWKGIYLEDAAIVPRSNSSLTHQVSLAIYY